MSAVLLISKTILLIGFAFAVFLGLAMALGVDPSPLAESAGCATKTPHLCLFTIV
ncbi:MAG: hypothetical protein AAF936_00660 [Pseudomonadota bacterium]